MRIQVLEPGDAARLEDFLRPRVDSSLFLLSNSRRAGLVDRGQAFEGTYYAARAGVETRGGRIAGVAAHYWQGNLVLQAPAGLEELVASIRRSARRPILGLLGPAAQVAHALELLAWTAAGLPEGGPARQIQVDEQEGLYSLALGRLIVPADLRAGRVSGRRIEQRDLDRVSAWRFAYHLEALGAAPTSELEEQCRRDMEASLERGDTWVLERGGEPVASTSFNAEIDEAVQVGGVWTPPELRRRGYGRAAVAVSLLDAREAGAERAILFTGDDNVGAIRAYAALGFERIGDYRIVLRRPP